MARRFGSILGWTLAITGAGLLLALPFSTNIGLQFSSGMLLLMAGWRLMHLCWIP